MRKSKPSHSMRGEIMGKAITTIDKALSVVETYLMVTSMVVFAFGVVIDVICRKFFGFNLSFMQELGKYLMVWATFLGASLGVKAGEHPAMTLIIDTVPTAPKVIMTVLSNLVSAGACGFIGYWSVQQFLLLERMGTMTTTLGAIPMYALYCIVPLGLIVMSLRFLARAYYLPREILAKKKDGETA